MQTYLYSSLYSSFLVRLLFSLILSFSLLHSSSSSSSFITNPKTRLISSLSLQFPPSMAAAASSTSQVYIDVIEDVMTKVRDEFINNGGPGEEVLRELQAVISSSSFLIH
jgi:hypothetical protein